MRVSGRFALRQQRMCSSKYGIDRPQRPRRGNRVLLLCVKCSFRRSGHGEPTRAAAAILRIKSAPQPLHIHLLAATRCSTDAGKTTAVPSLLAATPRQA